MQGTVKWFSEEKGYGFLVGSDGSERYFHARNVKGAVLPKNGAEVEFEPVEGKKGPAAANVGIVSQPSRQHRDDRITCPHCKKTIVPRIITDRGSLSRSVCPFCGGTIQSFRTWWPWVVVLVLALLFFVLPALTGK